MNRIQVWFLAIAAVLLVHGCCSERNSTIPLVTDVGADVVTRHRYRLSCVYSSFMPDTPPKMIKFNDGFLTKCHPRVFSANGIPVVLRIAYDRYDSDGHWSVLVGMCSIGLIPGYKRMFKYFKCSIEMADVADGKDAFELENRAEYADTWVPTAFLFFNGAPSAGGHRVFYENIRHVGGENRFSPLMFEYDPAKRLAGDTVFQRALAYAMAVKLKEMEDAGTIGTMLKKKVEQRSVAPAHSIVRLDRDQAKNFSYSFAIELAQTPRNPREAVKAVLREFMDSVKEDYLDTYPAADAKVLKVAFSDMKVEGRLIAGRASVLTIVPVSLTYDANTRRGKLAVKFSAGQEEEARAWARRNVKMLARDRNIALTTGQLPPEATYYLLGEKVEGNVMEIEFKTE